MKDLVKSIQVKEKETHNLNKNLDNARLTIKSLKSESSKLGSLIVRNYLI